MRSNVSAARSTDDDEHGPVVRVTIDTLPGEVVLSFEGLDLDGIAEVLCLSFNELAWPRFVSAVVKAAPYGVPPGLDLDV